MKDKTEVEFQAEWKKMGVPANETVLVAVSTGCDSMTLLSLLQRLPEKMRPTVQVAYVDHQLREQSKKETDFITKYCQKNGLVLFKNVWEKEFHPKKGIEESAREFRYRFFEKIMEETGIGYLLTAHHSNDQAETILMKAVRGGDLEQLVGIKSARTFGTGNLLRPLLHFSKETLKEYAERNQIKYFEDETNALDDVLRNRLRHHVVPFLEKENRHFLTHVEELSLQLKDLLDYSDKKIVDDCLLLKVEGGYSLEKWLKQDESQKRLTLKHILKQAGNFSLKKQEQCVKMLENDAKPQGSLALGNSCAFFRTYGIFGIKKTEKNNQESENKIFKLEPGKWYSLSEREKIGIFRRDKIDLLPEDDVLEIASPNDLLLRHRRCGDVLKTKNGSQKIKKILIDKKIALDERKKLWLVVNGENQAIWVIGVKKSDLSRGCVNAKIQYIAVFRK